MNERIKKLLNVCGMPNEDLMEIYSDTNKTFYMEQFAEMIVKECVLEAMDAVHHNNSIRLQLYNHFGIA